MDFSTEAKITINGVKMTFAQSMVIRVALESFARDLHMNGLGDDVAGALITAGYLRNIKSIRPALYLNQP